MDSFWKLPRYPFTLAAIEYAREHSGVYALFDGDEAVYIGRALESDGGIRAVLLMHLRNTSHGTNYTWEISRSPEVREAELLAEFREKHARLPRWHKSRWRTMCIM